jgi:hypothetical protein
VVKGAFNSAVNLNIVPAGAEVGVTLILVIVVFTTVAACAVLNKNRNDSGTNTLGFILKIQKVKKDVMRAS